MIYAVGVELLYSENEIVDITNAFKYASVTIVRNSGSKEILITKDMEDMLVVGSILITPIKQTGSGCSYD